MSLQNISPEELIGRLVWVFRNGTDGRLTSELPIHGIIIDKSEVKDAYIVLCESERRTEFDIDLEFVEDWSEDLEREDGSSEEP